MSTYILEVINTADFYRQKPKHLGCRPYPVLLGKSIMDSLSLLPPLFEGKLGLSVSAYAC